MKDKGLGYDQTGIYGPSWFRVAFSDRLDLTINMEVTSPTVLHMAGIK